MVSRTFHFPFWLAVIATIAVACDSPATPDPYPDGPKISCPLAPLPVTSQNLQPVPVQFGAATATGGAPNVVVSCSAASGSLFPVGTTTVTCTATDARQRMDSCSFPVVVQPGTPTIAVTSFVAFGDSITYGEDGNPSVLCGSNNNSVNRTLGLIRPLQQVAQPYPSILSQALAARYATQSAIIGVANAGQPGEAAGDKNTGGPLVTTLNRFKTVLNNGPGPLGSNPNAGNFQSVLLMEGTNDIFYSNGDPNANAEIQAAIAGLRAMIDEAKARRLRPFLATVPPMIPGRDRSCGNREVGPLNDQIRLLAGLELVPLVEVYAGLSTSTAQYIGPDGLHPSQAGYTKIAQIFFDALKATLELPPGGVTPTTPGRRILQRPSEVRPAPRRR